MELGLSLQPQSNYKPVSFVENTGTDLGFCMAVGKDEASSDPPLHLHLLPSNNFPFPTCLTQNSLLCEEGPTHSSPSSTVSSFQMEFRNLDEITAETRVLCRGSDAENYGSATATKKLRLSKQQSAFLEETFKEHTTLNPIEKVSLAKRLNLRPRQVEVWFQNRRARSKLKQTEVDCEYLNKYCETLREENKRLQKELQELRALNASNPFYMQLPATTLTMCPSCQRLPTADADANSGAGVTIVANNVHMK